MVGTAPLLHTLILRDGSAPLLRAAADALHAAPATLLRRLDVLLAPDVSWAYAKHEEEADALAALCDALPPSMRVFSLDVRLPLEEAEPLLAAALHATLRRCPDLLAAHLAAQTPPPVRSTLKKSRVEIFAADAAKARANATSAARALARAAEARLAAEAHRSHPALRTTFMVYDERA